jgi:AraC family transcriptional regulator, regulatory protein of adaptative response / methylated-DNA-[protein]-cysteine methyltransferase
VEQNARVRHNLLVNDYERVASIIRFLDAQHSQQPDLDELASRLKLSRYHFHRLFSRWAGVTPKDFLQCLTMQHARERLRRGATVLETAFDSGLSSPSRLHDLCMTLEAATPGEIKTGGAGWTIEVGCAESPFGWCVVGTGPRGVCHLAFVDARERQNAAASVAELWPGADVRRNDRQAREIVEQIFQFPRNGSPATLRAFVRATPFQLRVWRALLRVPTGALVSYGNLAAAVGSPAAARAVGTAVGSNPVAFLIPCHRVIRETGVMGEYRWGRERKRLMLGWEDMRRSSSVEALR